MKVPDIERIEALIENGNADDISVDDIEDMLDYIRDLHTILHAMRSN
jgi:hypothetical protein